MPFTFSHPAAAVPLARWGLPVSALVVGGMSPDFPYFLQLSTHTQFGHSISGIFTFCVPASLVVLWLWHRVLDMPLQAISPHSFQRYFPKNRFKFAPMKRLLLICFAIMLGALTYIIWDSFTHANGFVVRHWPLLQTPIWQTAHNTICVYKILQHDGSLFGALVLLRIAQKSAPRQVSAEKRNPNAKIAAALIVNSFVCALSYATSRQMTLTNWKFELFVRTFAISSIAILFVELLIWSVCWHVKKRENQPYSFW